MSRARDLADRVLHNRTHEDTDGGRESILTFKGEQSGGEISTLAQIQASHDGTSDDEKADLIFKTNDGSDGASPTERMRIDSAGAVTFTSDDTSDQFVIQNNDTGSGSAPDMVLYRNSASPADGDTIGRIDYRGEDDGGTARDYVTLYSKISDASTGTPAGSFHIQTRNGTNQTDRLVVDGSGIVTMPNQPSFHATLSINQTGYDATTSSGTQDYIQYNSDIYDIGNNHSGGTFTAPVDGVYLFRADAYANVGWSQTWWLVNGARAAGTDTVYVGSTSFAHSSAILKLSENDTVRYRGYISGATNATIYAHANHTWFRGILIG